MILAHETLTGRAKNMASFAATAIAFSRLYYWIWRKWRISVEPWWSWIFGLRQRLGVAIGAKHWRSLMLSTNRLMADITIRSISTGFVTHIAFFHVGARFTGNLFLQAFIAICNLRILRLRPMLAFRFSRFLICHKLIREVYNEFASRSLFPREDMGVDTWNKSFIKAKLNQIYLQHRKNA